jgi:hypothetical protein
LQVNTTTTRREWVVHYWRIVKAFLKRTKSARNPRF